MFSFFFFCNFFCLKIFFYWHIFSTVSSSFFLFFFFFFENVNYKRFIGFIDGGSVHYRSNLTRSFLLELRDALLWNNCLRIPTIGRIEWGNKKRNSAFIWLINFWWTILDGFFNHQKKRKKKFFDCF